MAFKQLAALLSLVRFLSSSGSVTMMAKCEDEVEDVAIACTM